MQHGLKKYKPIELIEVFESFDTFDEDKYTLDYMSKFGINEQKIFPDL